MEKLKIVQYGKTIDVIKGELKLRKTFEEKEDREIIKSIGSEIKMYQEKEKLSKKDEVLLKKLENNIFDKMKSNEIKKIKEKETEKIIRKTVSKKIEKSKKIISKLNSKLTVDELLNENKQKDLEIKELKENLKKQKEQEVIKPVQRSVGRTGE